MNPLTKSEGTVFSGQMMATALPKRLKESKLEITERSWMAKPILGRDFTEDPPNEEVYVGLLKERKDISTAIQSISNILPGFSHLKRCSSNRLLLAPLKSSETRESLEEGGILSESKLKTMLKEKGFNLSLLEDDFQVLKVPSRVPKTKAQAARASKIWPVNFHPDPNIENLIDGSIFTDHQLGLIENYMRVAIEAARLEAVGNANCNSSALIVDPEDGKILAIAASRIDQHPMWHAAMLAIDLVAKLQGGGAWKLDEEMDTLPLNPSSTKSDDQKKSNDMEETEIEKELGTTCQDDTNYEEREKNIKRKYVEEAPLCYPKSLSKILLPKEESLKSINTRRGRNNNGSNKILQSESLETTNSEKCGPYLCTGYWTFLLKEPCPLCAMALLHSRVSRIFYGTTNQSTGVLGTKAILHAVPGLNHRYQVWSGILESECERTLKEIESKIID